MQGLRHCQWLAENWGPGCRLVGQCAPRGCLGGAGGRAERNTQQKGTEGRAESLRRLWQARSGAPRPSAGHGGEGATTVGASEVAAAKGKARAGRGHRGKGRLWPPLGGKGKPAGLCGPQKGLQRREQEGWGPAGGLGFGRRACRGGWGVACVGRARDAAVPAVGWGAGAAGRGWENDRRSPSWQKGAGCGSGAPRGAVRAGRATGCWTAKQGTRAGVATPRRRARAPPGASGPDVRRPFLPRLRCR